MIYAATGHRPGKLGGYSINVQDKLVNLATVFLTIANQTGNNVTISGMALGWDQAWAIASINLKIPFIAAIPFKGQENLWPKEAREKYRDLLNRANKIVTISLSEYSAKTMQDRNEWMVDNCNKLVALWDGSSGGTANCIAYARQYEKEIINLWHLYKS